MAEIHTQTQHNNCFPVLHCTFRLGPLVVVNWGFVFGPTAKL